jgi:hypothetical protein
MPTSNFSSAELEEVFGKAPAPSLPLIGVNVFEAICDLPAALKVNDAPAAPKIERVSEE